MNSIKHIRIKVQVTPNGPNEWRFNLIDAETNKLLPVSTNDKMIIEYNSFDRPIKVTATLFVDDIDIEITE